MKTFEAFVVFYLALNLVVSLKIGTKIRKILEILEKKI